MKPNIVPLAVLVLTATQTAVWAQTMNVQSLMGDGYAVAGVTSPPTGGRAYSCRKAMRLFFVLSPRSPVRQPSIRNIANQ